MTQKFDFYWINFLNIRPVVVALINKVKRAIPPTSRSTRSWTYLSIPGEVATIRAKDKPTAPLKPAYVERMI